MGYNTPPHIFKAKIDVPELRYTWDDWKASDLFTFEPEDYVEKAVLLTTRARLALGIGIYEWIIWRYRSLLNDEYPFHVAEAAWGAIRSHEAVDYIELDRRQWLGPIKGPLWCAVTWLDGMIFWDKETEQEGVPGEGELSDGLDYLISLAMHVLPEPDKFERWLNLTIDRLSKYYTDNLEDDLFDNLFGEKDTGGDLISPEAMDPEFDYDPDDADKLLKKFMKSIDVSKNPLCLYRKG